MLSGYRTLIGALIALLAEALRLYGVEIGPEYQAGLINSIVVIGGIGYAIYGRIVATRRLSPPGELR